MKIFLSQAIFHNVAPFGDLTLNFAENEIAVLTAVNGKGKTTILSYLADAFHEAAKVAYHGSFEGKESKFYRVSSAISALNMAEKFAVYFKFQIQDEDNNTKPLVFLELRGAWTEPEITAQFSEPPNPANQITKHLSENDVYKTFKQEKKRVKDIFQKNVVTYFPSYRYEEPSYLNDPYKISPHFKMANAYAGYLNNPIEVISGLPTLTNWLLDVVLDLELSSMNTYQDDNGETRRYKYELHHRPLMQAIEKILGAMLNGKFPNHGAIGLKIGTRNLGMARLQVINRTGTEIRTLYPSIFQISSGEAALLCVFAEIVRQADNNQVDIKLEDITGIVLIDEVDKHLHIKMQKEVLPQLFQLFPNVQFIVSSHSPFLSMGLAQTCPKRSRLINIDQGGLSQEPSQNPLYEEVYAMMIAENERFKEGFEALKNQVQTLSRPLIVTEGKTDAMHLKKAKEQLGIADDFDFFEISESGGASKLEKYLNNLGSIGSPKKVIGIFDRDRTDDVAKIEKDGQSYKKYGKNVFAFCLPKVDEHKYGEQISIEHYYPRELLLKENSKGRRLFLAEEFIKSSRKSKKTQNPFETTITLQVLSNKCDVNGIIDEQVFKESDRNHENSIALSKADFARLIESDSDFVGAFNFKTFRRIFCQIANIIAHKD
jgi:predicted ATPase